MSIGDSDYGTRLRLHILVRLGNQPLPFFAEYPYFLWGEVAYESDGDCVQPTDRQWHWLHLEHRETRERVVISRDSGDSRLCHVNADHEVSGRLSACLTALRSDGYIVDQESGRNVRADEYGARLSQLHRRLEQAETVHTMFLNPALSPFDSMWWWGGWKWTGRFASDFAIGQRLAMLAVQEGHADAQTTMWLRSWWDEGPEAPERAGVRAALTAATGSDPDT